MDLKTMKLVRRLADDKLIDVALKLLARDPTLFNELNGGIIHVTIRDVPYTVSEEQLTKLQNITESYGSKKVTTIKEARQMFDIGLKEAKDLIEELTEAGHFSKDCGRSPTIDPHFRSTSCVVVVG